MSTPPGFFPLGDFSLRSGEILPHAKLGFQTWGTLACAEDNVILLPSYYSGTTRSYEPWVLPGKHQIFDPKKYFVVAYDQFGAGLSSKPSTDCTSLNQWPHVTIEDNVRAAKLLLDHLGIAQVQLVMGWSMGGMQAFSWTHRYPTIAKRAFALCATPQCNPVNYLFLEGLRGILCRHDTAGIRFLSDEDRDERLSAFGKVYAGWAYSDAFFLHEEYRQFGYQNLDKVLDGWAADHLSMNVEDLLAQLDTWENSFVQAPTPKQTLQTPRTNRPHILAMPCSTDRYFSPEALENQLVRRNDVETVILESTLGHIAGRPGIRIEETDQIKAALRRFEQPL